MGADLIISVLAEPADPDVKLNWEAGAALIDAATSSSVLDEWTTNLDDAGRLEDLVEDGDVENVDHAKVKAEIKSIFEKLRTEVIDPEGYPPRDVNTIKVRDLWLTISGGMSHGDSPTEACEHMDAAGHFPDILEAIGFVIDWDQELST